MTTVHISSHHACPPAIPGLLCYVAIGWPCETVPMLLDGHSTEAVAENLGLGSVSLLCRWKAKPFCGSPSPCGSPGLVHGSTSPGSRTFSVNLANERCYCHKCHSRGNQLELWAAVHKLSLYYAALDLCRALAREVPWIHRW